MKEKINKTNVARLLDKAKVKYELIPYEVDENDLSAPHVAESLGENIEQVFKTLASWREVGTFRVCHPWRTRSGLENGSQGIGQQEVRFDSDEGTPATHRIHPGRVFAYRHEETFSYVYS